MQAKSPLANGPLANGPPANDPPANGPPANGPPANSPPANIQAVAPNSPPGAASCPTVAAHYCGPFG